MKQSSSNVLLGLDDRFIRTGFLGDVFPIYIERLTAARVDHHDSFPPHFELNDHSTGGEQFEILLNGVKDNKVLKKVLQYYQQDRNRWLSFNGMTDLELKSILSRAFKKGLCISPNDTKVVVIDHGFSVNERVRITKVLLKGLGVKSVSWYRESILLSLSTTSRNSLSVQLKWNSFIVTSVFDLREVQSNEVFNEFSGLSFHYFVLEKLLEMNDHDVNELLTSKSRFNIIEKFISTFYVRPEGENTTDTGLFALTDSVTVPNRLRCEIVEKMYFGYKITRLISDHLKRLPIDLRSVMLKNIVISGELSFLPGFKARVLQELRVLFENTKKADDIKCVNSVGSWAGCSLYCNLLTKLQLAEFISENEITDSTLRKASQTRTADIALFS
ncbi:Piso0_001607 [Millerozyma farinosa CBS 7064]|uniref:Piso0_001607 protein n=1 Tax=Pichia sorbitophila (strain ATCC MYA-4447 / BCRC 22081 / CBS 7064 / NBRC 10061 / NRRL Y-12695) TaxID=559304 RepID=G8YL87_PICSO|nr:Piso0_001607 [Millerozyma farinosa CBS 7064]